MLYKDRPHIITDVPDVDTLVHKLTQHTWTVCDGFRWQSLTLLNDSTGPGGAQEYTVVRSGREIESLTVSWMEPEKLHELLVKLDDGSAGGDYGAVDLVSHPKGYCARCA